MQRRAEPIYPYIVLTFGVAIILQIKGESACDLTIGRVSFYALACTFPSNITVRSRVSKGSSRALCASKRMIRPAGSVFASHHPITESDAMPK